jgi:glucosamine-6-phosphate deaminase
MCRQQQVNDKCFAALVEVPVEALTLSIPALSTPALFLQLYPEQVKPKL